MSRTVLIIDDDEGVRDAFSLALQAYPGLDCRVAADGAEGIELARARRPDLVFLDLNMPGMSGVEVLRALLGWDPTLSVYIVTAFHEDFMHELRAAMQDGLSFQLARKPLGADQIRLVVRGALEGATPDHGACAEDAS